MAEQHNWLRANVRQNYLWADLTPDVSPVGYTGLAPYFRALLFAGSETIPADRFSGYGSAQGFTQFYGEGKTMGYGVAVAGQEVRGQPWAPLRIRHVEAASPAAAAGLRRGQRVLAIQGRTAAEVIAADDFSGLSATQEGQVLQLRIEEAGEERSVQVVAGVYTLTPAFGTRVLTSPGGRRLGYVVVQNMVNQTEPELARAFAEFAAQGVDAVVLDLRYNGGGLVSVGARLASYVAGARAVGQLYARLQFRPAQSAFNLQYGFYNPGNWAGVSTVYVLSGMRTCSASEQVIHGLRGVGLEVVTVGSTTCGKPVGFSPRTYCDRTFSLVNFESVNATGRGGYYDGLPAVCAVPDDPRQPLGAPWENLLAAALRHADGLGCATPKTEDSRTALGLEPGVQPLRWVEPDLWQGMVGR